MAQNQDGSDRNAVARKSEWGWREAVGARLFGLMVFVAPKHTLDALAPMLVDRIRNPRDAAVAAAADCWCPFWLSDVAPPGTKCGTCGVAHP